jgi:hypothetical protein
MVEDSWPCTTGGPSGRDDLSKAGAISFAVSQSTRSRAGQAAHQRAMKRYEQPIGWRRAQRGSDREGSSPAHRASRILNELRSGLRWSAFVYFTRTLAVAGSVELPADYPIFRGKADIDRRLLSQFISQPRSEFFGEGIARGRLDFCSAASRRSGAIHVAKMLPLLSFDCTKVVGLDARFTPSASPMLPR